MNRILLGVGVCAVTCAAMAATLPTAKYPLQREYSRLVGREGRLVWYDRTAPPMDAKAVGHRPAFMTKSGDGLFVLLENKNLEILEANAPAGSGVDVRVSGTVYEYKSHNYLLLGRVAVKP